MARGNGRKGDGSVAIDDIDLRILELLHGDGRLSVAALASEAGISRANAYARLERLRTAGVIEGFSARVNHEKLGLGVTAIILLTVRSPARDALVPFLRTLPGVEFAGFVTGEHDVALLVRAPGVTALREQILSPLTREATVRSSHTVLVLDEVVNNPFVLPLPNGSRTS